MSVAVAPMAGQMLLALERRIVDAQDRHDELARKLQALRDELSAVDTEVDDLVSQLRVAGRRRVDMGDLRRTTPLSPLWGADRGLPIDRHYIHAFLDRHRHDITGRVLEVKDAGYTRMFGDGRVTSVDVVDIDALNPNATVVADLARADAIPSNTYDCFILTQTLGVIYDVAGALRHALRVLKPGGVLLCSLPAAGRLSHEEGLNGDFWRFTEASVRRLLGDVVPPDAVELDAHGNVLAGAAFLYGLAAHELTPDELNVKDPYLPLVYTVRVVKPTPHEGGALRPRRAPQPARAPRAVVLAYHRICEPSHRDDRLSVTPAEFGAQLEHLRSSGYQALPLRELVLEARSGTLTRDAVALTFDDGYADALDTVAPLLESLALPATFFVVSGAIDAAEVHWWDTLDGLFGPGTSTPSRLVASLPDGPVDVSTATADERRLAHHALVERLYRLDHERRADAMRTLVDWAGPAARPIHRGPMTADQVRRLAAIRGISIGAHSTHHERLPMLDRATRIADLRSCRTRLEALLGAGVTTLSYPYGAADDDTAAAAREAGFTLAVTTAATRVTTATNPLLVPRIDPGRSVAELTATLAAR